MRTLCAVLLLALVSGATATLDYASFYAPDADAIRLQQQYAEDERQHSVAFDATMLTDGGSRTNVVYDDQHIDASAEYVESFFTHAEHEKHVMQAAGVFDVQLRTAAAPWSHRIQPGVSFRKVALSYQQRLTNLTQRVGTPFMIMYEGAMTNNGVNIIENDIWLSMDEGVSWDIIAGRSLYGRSGAVNATRIQSFTPRRGSNNCADPMTDILISVGGVASNTETFTNEVWHSFDGYIWQQQNGQRYAPARHFSSSDIDESGHIFVIGGHAIDTTTGQHYFLNDVWQSNALWSFNPWKRITAAAAFSPREEHLVLVANNTMLKADIIYSIGGRSTCTNIDCYNGLSNNEVWASSDNGVTFVPINARPPFGPRWGAAGVVTTAGVLIMWGGLNSATGAYADTQTYREVWASFDGGVQWNSCNVGTNNLWIRGEQGAAITPNGRLVILGGYSYNEGNAFQIRFNDVYRTSWNVENVREVATRCGGVGVIPAAGVGLRQWPNTPSVPTNTLTFTPLTRRAPWSPRIQPALLMMEAPRTFINPDNGAVSTTGSNWLLLYEGSLTANNLNENDVYASADNGATWNLISGISRLGTLRDRQSANPESSFRATSGSSNTEDPRNDNVYSIGGIIITPQGPGVPAVTTYSNEVWFSSNAIDWSLRNVATSFAPGRYFHQCRIDKSGRLFVLAGLNPTVTPRLLNDVWVSVNNNGAAFNLVTRNAPWAARYEADAMIVHSELYDSDMLYVTGGITDVNNMEQALNDVWIGRIMTANGRTITWVNVFKSGAPNGFPPRWGHGVEVTNAGVMMVMGGTSSAPLNTYSDLYVSMNGGVRWYSCRVNNAVAMIRGEQAVEFSTDERLIIGTGYRYEGNYRSEYSDMWISDQSFAKASEFSRYCTGATVIGGYVGYQNAAWGPGYDSTGSEDPDNPTPSTSSGGISTTTVIIIVAVVLVALGAGYYSYLHHEKTGSWNPFDGATEKPKAVDNHASLHQ